MSEDRVLADGAEELAELAARVLRAASSRKWQLAAAESCTGGLLASLLTDIEGLSGGFERGFVCYSPEAKAEMLGIERIAIERHGAVSREIALEMAKGALAFSHADLAAAITGFAGPGGKHDEAGLVHIAVQSRDGKALHRECHFGNVSRDRARQLATHAALEMLASAVENAPTEPAPLPTGAGTDATS
jgi:nicotinamide-nucleotide amidase